MRAEVNWVPGPWPGRLGIVPRPRGGDWLRDDVRSWREAGFGVVASLLTPEEETELGLQLEMPHARGVGLEFHAFPIPDRGVPASRTETDDLIRALKRALESGRSVALHCRQGIGRSAPIAAALLVSTGEEPQSAFRTIEAARGIPVPETDAQREWVEELALEVAVGSPYRGGGMPVKTGQVR